jgi:acyl-CoA synthetase (NDP forming)
VTEAKVTTSVSPPELAAVTARKPVVIWKGGSTHDGARVTANHTGSSR